MRLIILALLSVLVLAQEKPPEPVSVEDQLAISRMQLEGLKAALRYKDEEVKMLRARVEYFEARERMERQRTEAIKHKDAMDLKEQSLKGKYRTPLGYFLSEDLQWEKGPTTGINTGGK